MSPYGLNEDFEVISTISVSSGVFAIVAKAALVTRHWVWPSVVCYLVSLVALFALLLLENSFVVLFPNYYNVMLTALSLPIYWMNLIIVVAICIVPEISCDYSQRMFCPYYWQIVQEQYIDVAEDSYVDEDYTEIQMIDRSSNIPVVDPLDRNSVVALSPRNNDEASLTTKFVGDFSSDKGKSRDPKRRDWKEDEKG